MSRLPRWVDHVALALVIVSAIALLILNGCAVPVRNEFNDKPLLVAPVGTTQMQPDGSTLYNAALPQPKAEDYQHAPGIDPWKLGGLAALLIGGPGAYLAVQRIRMLTQSVKDATAFGSSMESAETDADVARVKQLHATRQAANGTMRMIQRARGKA